MRRREFIVAIIGGATTWSSQTRAQQRPIPLVGMLFPRAVDPVADPSIAGFRRGLRELGYVEGQSIYLELRFSGGDNSRLPILAAELAALKPDVIVTNGEAAIRAAIGAGGAIPIVMAVVDDPVRDGFVRSLAHPGGNVTGLSNLAVGLVAKRLRALAALVSARTGRLSCTQYTHSRRPLLHV